MLGIYSPIGMLHDESIIITRSEVDIWVIVQVFWHPDRAWHDNIK